MNVVIVTLVKHQKGFFAYSPHYFLLVVLYLLLLILLAACPLGKAQTGPRLSVKLYFPFKTA